MRLLDQFGQPAIRTQLDTILAKGRLPHAILFYGDPGAGILPAALSLVADILCTQPIDGKACHTCSSCHRTEKLIHPDLHFLLPLAGAKSLSTDFYPKWREAATANPWLDIFQWTQFADVEGKQVDIHKEDIVQTTHNFNLQAYEGGNKVMIIWMAQYLTREGNRLLKMIEEPQPQTYFILISNQREQILPTIRSRCMQIFCPPISPREMEKLLVYIYQAKPEQASMITAQAGYDMNRAHALMHHSMMDFMEELTVWFRALVAQKVHELAQWATKMGTQEKEEQKQFALFVISFIRKLIWANTQTDTESIRETQQDMIRYLTSRYSPDMWYPVMEEVQTAYEKIARNANSKLLWLAVSISIKNQLAGIRHQHITA
jgi:DNA polymerase-3 subunit delta'